MKRVAFIAFSIVTLSYVLLGAVVFHFIEGKNEEETKESFELDHEKFLESNTCLTPEALREYVIKVVEAHASGVSVITIAKNTLNSTAHNSTNSTSSDDDDEHHHSKWDIISAFFFCMTVVSTVGYGNIAPKTEGGQVFCIFFALIGIPLFATSMVGVGERLQIPLTRIKKCKAWCKMDPKKDEQVKTAVFLTSGICILIFIPSYVLSRTENWSFIESLYFCVITLTTIGFGDYLPAGNQKHFFYIYRIILAVWILLGLSWIALILSELASIMQEKIIEATKRTSNKLVDFEDMVKKKAKDAKEKIVQKGNDEIPAEDEEMKLSIDPDVYVVVSTTRNSPRPASIDNNGTPGSYRRITANNSSVPKENNRNCIDHIEDDKIRRDDTLTPVDVD